MTKRNFFLCILLTLVGIGSASAQTAKLSFNMVNKTVKEVLDEVEKQSDFVFIYSDGTVDLKKTVTLEVKDQPIDQVLNRLFAGSDNTYIIKKRQVYINKKTPAPAPETSAKSIELSGVVISNTDNQPVIGASVFIDGTSIGTTTDINGEYTLTVPTSTKEISFSYLGYITLRLAVKDRNLFRLVTIYEDSQSLEEVTVVAFGKQKKNSVIGSITTMNVKDLKVPSSNLTTALAGNMAGIIAYQRSGEPGQDNADFFVRGITTFSANTKPLILIDNIELTTTDLARLQPDDIASFSVMKDATATALYGARGANGVVLVTTKRGEVGPAKVSIRLENSLSAPTMNVEFADPVTYMKAANEAVLTRDRLGEQPYGMEKIDNTARPGSNPLLFPANDWRKMLFNDYAMNQRATLNVSGGGTVARYYVSGSFSRDNGVLKVPKESNFNNNIDLKNYTLRANVDVDLTKTTELAVRLSGNFDDYSGPMQDGSAIYKMVVHANPVRFPAYYPTDEAHAGTEHIMFGNYRNSLTNPYAEMVRGYKDYSRSQMLSQLEAKQDLSFITQGLSLRAMLNLSRYAFFDVFRQYNPYWYEVGAYDIVSGNYTVRNTNTNGTEYLNYSEGEKKVESTIYTETMLNYAHTFAKKHDVSGLLVFTTREYIKANTGSLQLSLPSRNLGLSGRATYGYDNRYFAEFNFGYNGSERFAASHRFGFFPSAGAAWNIANEPFWEDLQATVNNLKLRYSYGLVGNDQIGDANDRFFYLSNVNPESDKYGRFGTNMDRIKHGYDITRYANEDITWEVSTKQNVALELGLWNKVSLITEYFTEYRKNILMDRSYIPATMGLTAPLRANLGEASGKGVDMMLEYQQFWTPQFWTSARGNFTYATARYEVYEEPDYNEPWRYHTGRKLNQEVGYIAERLFMDDAEAQNSPTQGFGDEYGGGDIKYTDVNRDGVITVADQVPLGYPTVPEIVYGFGVSAGYKGFDISCFFQGVANESFWINAAATSPFYGEAQFLKAYADSYWSEDNQNLYATWPRLSSIINSNNVPGYYRDSNDNLQVGTKNTWFMRDGSFLRLKQAEIGYTIPGKWQKNLHLNNLRIYLSGTNLLLFSKFKLWDVEMGGEGLGYPLQRVFNIGINMTFN
jgi:TonB-linked SusC/RagA family outer membrane protein